MRTSYQFMVLSATVCFALLAGCASRNQELEVLAVEIVDSLATANYSAVTQYFDATMREKLPIEDLQSTWEALVRQYGPYEARTGTRVAKQAKYWIVFVTVDFAEKTLDVKVVFNSDNQVAGLWIVPESPD
ncbi:MAG: DUF3887 domain-containing protein [Candidatus Marinimicrobia bacterium]|nr:DUF3887 domain-containing protein [Candidatus Neomarinimicrobiota bacterium]